MNHTGSSHPALAPLRHCRDTVALRSALQALCARFGELQQLDILASRQPSGEQALCFLRLRTPAQEARLMEALGLGRFGGDIVVVVDMPPRTPRPPHETAARSANHSAWGGLDETPAALPRRA